MKEWELRAAEEVTHITVSQVWSNKERLSHRQRKLPAMMRNHWIGAGAIYSSCLQSWYTRLYRGEVQRFTPKEPVWAGQEDCWCGTDLEPREPKTFHSTWFPHYIPDSLIIFVPFLKIKKVMILVCLRQHYGVVIGAVASQWEGPGSNPDWDLFLCGTRFSSII